MNVKIKEIEIHGKTENLRILDSDEYMISQKTLDWFIDILNGIESIIHGEKA